MTLSNGILVFLKSKETIRSLVGNRIAPARAPQGETFPQIVYEMVSRPGAKTVSGPPRLKRPRYQFTVWAKSYEGAEKLAVALEKVLDGFKGQMGEVTVHGCFLENARDAIDPSPEADAARLYGRQLDFFIWHTGE